MDSCSYIRDDIRCKYPYTPTGGIPLSPNARNRAHLRNYACSNCRGLDPFTIPMVLNKIDAKEKAYTEAEIRAEILSTDDYNLKVRKRREERKQRQEEAARLDREGRNKVADRLAKRLQEVRGGRSKVSKRSKRTKRTKRSRGRKLRSTYS